MVTVKSDNLLHVIYSFFLGLVVVGFVGIGVNTFLPEPTIIDYSGTTRPAELTAWQLNTSVALVICATLVMVLSLVLTDRQAVIGNGLLLGGLFTMVYAVGMSISAGQSLARFAVILVALVVTVGVGYLKFVRGRVVPARVPASAPADLPGGDELVGRLGAVERKLDALARALSGD
ncbi:MAG TPA: hypothetical protein PLU22_17515 [Polyangiaceae bacterium]|nr:hypothetical protein [Polyangiaceae bacterium]